jgi:hypothetical protein
VNMQSKRKNVWPSVDLVNRRYIFIHFSFYLLILETPRHNVQKISTRVSEGSCFVVDASGPLSRVGKGHGKYHFTIPLVLVRMLSCVLAPFGSSMEPWQLLKKRGRCCPGGAAFWILTMHFPARSLM